MDDLTFGAARRIVEAPARDALEVGDRVEVISGRLKGAKGVLEEVETVPTPSGSTVKIARIRRPRAGAAWEFPHLLRRIEP